MRQALTIPWALVQTLMRLVFDVLRWAGVIPPTTPLPPE